MSNTRVSHDTRKKRSSRIALGKKGDHIVVTRDVAIKTSGTTSSLNGVTSSEPNKVAAPSRNCAKSVFGFYVESNKGINLSVDLNSTPRELVQNYPHSLVQIGSDETWPVEGQFKIGDIVEDAQLKASVKSGYMKEMAMKEDIGSDDKLLFHGRARLETSIKNEKLVEVAMEEDIDCGDKSPVCGGSQLTPRSDKHETEPPKKVTMKKGAVCNGKPPDSCQVSTEFSLAGLTRSSLASGGMSGGGGGGNGAVVHMEEAVDLLVEHLVRPVLPRRAGQDERHMTLEKQRAVAQQVHTAVIMYNYYHRKVCPKLAFADPKRFFTCAALSVGEDLLPYLNIAHARENDSGDDATLSVTDKGAIQACKIAAELDATKDYPDMGVWPIGKVAVLLLDPTKKKCLIEYGADTKGVWSFIEKEYDAASGISHSTNQPAGQESTNKTTFGALDGPLVLQQLAISEVQRRTGMDGSDLLVLDEDLTYSLSKGRTTTKLFIVEYKKTTTGKLVEVSLEELILSMNGPVFVNDPFLKTTSVVEYYHILPYKEILQGLLHRKWPDVPRHGLNSGIDEKLEEQGENSMSKMKKQTAKVSTPKQNKQAIKAAGANSNQNSNISKNKKSCKRKVEASRDTTAEDPDGESPIIENKHKKSCKGKAEASRTTAAQGPDDEIPIIENKHKKSCKRKAETSRITATEGPDGASPIIENESLIVPDIQTPGLPTKSINTKATTVVSGGPILPQSGDQVDKHKTQNDNMPQDAFLPMAPYVDHTIEGSLKRPNMEMTENSGGITENNNNQMYESLRSLQKIRDEILRNECILQERSIQIDMEIHTILNEGKVTPKALAIVDSYKGTCSNMTAVANSACSGDGGQTRSIKRNKLKQAFLNKCEELDAICKKCEWMLPRYAIVLSVADGMFRATVHLACSEFDMSIVGDPSPTPRKARYSAAANMIAELEKNKEEEDEEEQDS